MKYTSLWKALIRYMRASSKVVYQPSLDVSGDDGFLDIVVELDLGDLSKSLRRSSDNTIVP